MPQQLLLKQLAFYGAYHTNFWNQVIHLIFVPGIMATALVFVNYAPSLDAALWSEPYTPPPLLRYVEVNNGLWVVLLYASYYVLLEPFAGITWLLTHGVGCYAAATALRQNVGEGAWKVALAAHVLCWYMQIHPGHALLEKRKPALLDSLVQAFLLAPLFVWMELLFWCGYRPQLRHQLSQEVSALLAKMDSGPPPHK